MRHQRLSMINYICLAAILITAAALFTETSSMPKPIRDPRYERAADAAAKILTDHVDPKKSKGVQYFEIMWIIQAAMHLAEQDMKQQWREPSKN